MVAAKHLREPIYQSSANSLHLIQGSFSPKRVARQFPLIAGLHRAADGALIGVALAVALMSALTLHWQYLWTSAFSKLEITRDLTHRLTESTAMLEIDLLERSRVNKSMVPTKISKLIYLNSLDDNEDINLNREKKLIQSASRYSIHHGY